MIHFHNDGEISRLVMDILCSMAKEVIPECLGHNYQLFLADKNAKYVLELYDDKILNVLKNRTGLSAEIANDAIRRAQRWITVACGS